MNALTQNEQEDKCCVQSSREHIAEVCVCSVYFSALLFCSTVLRQGTHVKAQIQAT